MPFERISNIMETPDGSFVYAERNEAADEFRVVCSGCPDLQKTRYGSHFAAITTASLHSEHDPDQRHVPTRT